MKNILKGLGIAILIVALFGIGNAKAEDPLTGAALLYGHTGSEWKKVSVDSTGKINSVSTGADGSNVTLGAKADARSTATDTTAVTIMQVLKEISYMAQNPASRAVTNAGTFAVQNTDSVTATAGKTIKAAYSASQTAATVLTPASGKKVVITDVVISASGAGTVYIFDGTDSATTCITPTLSLAANSGYSANLKKPWQSATADNVIKYTSGSGAAGSIWIQYYEI